MLDYTARELNNMGYPIERAVELGRFIDDLIDQFGIVAIENAMVAFHRSLENRPKLS